MDLILRELREASPYPEHYNRHRKWWDHMRESFLHRTLFENPTESHDIILSLVRVHKHQAVEFVS